MTNDNTPPLPAPMPPLTYLLTTTLLLLLCTQAQATSHALLIGVSDYTDERVTDLEGPVNDVEALRAVLISHWQFDPGNITTLINEQASESAVLNALDSLATDTQPGDDLIIYFSGHGTSASDPDFGARLNLPDGTGAIVASDFNPDKLQPDMLNIAANDGLLIGRHELKPRLRKLDKERHVLVMFDACFSGNSARGLSPGYRPKHTRQLNLMVEFRALLEGGTSSDVPDETPDDIRFEYENTVYFGASAENQLAVDFSQAEIDAGLISSIDGKPHGGFTDSLLRALSEAPPGQSGESALSYAHLFNRVVNQFNIHCKVCGHTPVSLPVIDDASGQLLSRTILSADTLLAAAALYESDAESELNTQLIVESDLDISELQLAALLPPRAISLKNATNTASPDVYFEHKETAIEARSADGQLITHFETDATSATLQHWLGARQWLKQRTSLDLLNEQGSLRVEFRHPILGNQVSEGEFIDFTLSSDRDSRLLALLLDSRGALSVLYPVDTREAKATLLANTPRRIPNVDQLQIQVTAPWGTDSVLFYALPDQHELTDDILSDVLAMAADKSIDLTDPRLARLETVLGSGEIPYSASTIRIVANPLP